MKDLKGFVMYGGSALAVILVLVALGTSKQLSGATMGMIAIIAVVVVPLIISMQMAKKEQETRDQN